VKAALLTATTAHDKTSYLHTLSDAMLLAFTVTIKTLFIPPSKYMQKESLLKEM
jgi:hypothetical protein